MDEMLEGQPNQIHRTINTTSIAMDCSRDSPYITSIAMDCSMDNCKYKKLYGLFLWMGLNCLKVTVPLFAFYPRVLGTYLIDLARKKG